MSAKDIRRHRRVLYTGPIRLSWEDAAGVIKYAQVKTVDICEGGVRVEAPVPVPPQTYVTLRADRINLAGVASVRYVARHGSKYFLGLQLSSELRAGALKSLPQAATPQDAVPVS